MLGNNHLQEATGASTGLDNILKVVDLMSNKDKADKFLKKLQTEQEKLKDAAKKAAKEVYTLSKLKDAEKVIKDAKAYKESCKKKAEALISVAQAKSDVLLYEAEAMRAEAKVNLSSSQKKEISFVEKEKLIQRELESAEKSRESAERLERKFKENTAHLKTRIKNLNAIVADMKNV